MILISLKFFNAIVVYARQGINVESYIDELKTTEGATRNYLRKKYAH